jgi:hypothetical protein
MKVFVQFDQHISSYESNTKLYQHPLTKNVYDMHNLQITNEPNITESFSWQ